MTFPHKIILHRLGISQKDDKPLQSRAYAVDHAAIMALSLDFGADQWPYETIASGRYTEERRRLLSDQKLPFDQFQPRRLVISTARVIATQASTTVSHFLTDQLEVEMKREQLVKEGKLTEKEADQLNEEWEQKEWSALWSTFGQKCVHGVLKFHAITLVMRFYERLLQQTLLKGRAGDVTLDRLTRDPFKAAELTWIRAGPDTSRKMRKTFELCFWSNVIAFLADYTVHQIILASTYYMYCREKKRQRIQDREHEEESEGEDGAMAMSFVFKSSKLIVTRGLGLLGAAGGGAVGTYIYPGWGTTIGISFGDGLMASALEERT